MKRQADSGARIGNDRRWAKARLGALVIALAVLTGLLASAINGEVLLARWWGRELKISDAPWLWLAGLLAAATLAVATTWALIHFSEVLLPVQSVEPDGAPHPCQAVMVFLSRPHPRSRLGPLPPDRGDGFEYTLEGAESLVLASSGSGPQLERWLGAAMHWQEHGSQWNWLPMLRALQPHTAELSRICILVSNETLTHAPVAQALLAAASGVPPGHVSVAPAFDIEDFDAAYRTMAAVLQLWRSEGISASRVMIDITGGSRPGCIAGAMLTLDRDVTFQHLVQHPPYTRLIAYRKRFEMERKVPTI